MIESHRPAARVEVAKNVQIDPEARIHVTERLVIGEGTSIRRGALLEGRSITLGRECWIDEYAHIGGGSCFDWQSELVAGDHLHMGRYALINTARRVVIGSEVGLGISTKIFTHGAYLSAFDGFPVKFAEVHVGNRVWIPNAWVNPGVTIGDDVVVAAMSLVNRDLPSGCLAGGVPARVLRPSAYPREITREEKQAIVEELNQALQTTYALSEDRIVVVGKHHRPKTVFDLGERRIAGPADRETELLKNQLRRMGIRFRYSNVDGRYERWPS